MSKHFRDYVLPQDTFECEPVESCWGDYQQGELDSNGICRTCGVGPYMRALELGYCPRCDDYF